MVPGDAPGESPQDYTPKRRALEEGRALPKRADKKKTARSGSAPPARKGQVVQSGEQLVEKSTSAVRRGDQVGVFFIQ